MPRLVPEMSDAKVRRLRHGTKNGQPTRALHAVGGVAGLLLQCGPPAPGCQVGARSWIVRVKVGNKRREFGLGGYPNVTLSQARDRAREVRDKIERGVDPVTERRSLRSALIADQAKAVTFSDLAGEYIKKKSKEFKSLKQTYKLTQQLEVYAYPQIGRLLVSDIDRAHIVKMLQVDDLWTTKHETASRVRLHVERILDLAGVKGLRSGDNPARWKGNLDLSLPAGHKVANKKNHNALPVEDMPEFWRQLVKEDKLGARVLRFTILTAARPGEARGALWDEIDFNRKLWIIPAERMKGGKEHKIPLTAEAVKLLESEPRQNQYVFPGPKAKPVSDVAVSKVPKILGHDVTAHGFRATFRTWVQEYTAYAEEVAELALAHVNSDATRAAYARGELIEKRRLMMQEWARFCQSGKTASRSGTVTKIGVIK